MTGLSFAFDFVDWNLVNFCGGRTWVEGFRIRDGEIPVISVVRFDSCYLLKAKLRVVS